MTPTPFTSAAITSLCRTVILTQRSLALGTGIEGGRYGSDTRNGNGNGNENISNAPPTVDRRRIT